MLRDDQEPVLVPTHSMGAVFLIVAAIYALVAVIAACWWSGS